ncbi:MAG: aminotransferase class V-fold PLP-dependent enzyme [Clostridia bacterium]|nr:aminotransferase class V-fold PLP-dependent enzyme [Clostridia bacterium]
MIYLDNGATTFPKPEIVRKAVSDSFAYSANPGRAGHKMSLKAAETIYNCRSKIADMFGTDKPENVIFTLSCTLALNTVIKGVLKKGDHVVISSLEHNSVVRPLEKLCEAGIITYDIAKVYENDNDKTLDSFRKSFKDKTKLVICTHASNVFGNILPVSRIAALCRYYGILFCLDSAQSAGIINIDINEIGVDFLCAPGHKGLYGPMGTGFLIINSNTIPDSIYEGGTGSGSSVLTQPQILPDKFESGTVNLSGIAGLSAGIDFVNHKGLDSIYHHEMSLITMLYRRLSQIKGVRLYTAFPNKGSHVPLISFNIDGIDCDEVARLLDDKFSIAVRAGLHCSPVAHRHYNTEDSGTVRVCPSVFTSRNDINIFINAVTKIINKEKFIH